MLSKLLEIVLRKLLATPIQPSSSFLTCATPGVAISRMLEQRTLKLDDDDDMLKTSIFDAVPIELITVR